MKIQTPLSCEALMCNLLSAVAVGLFIFARQTHAQSGAPLWTNYYDGPLEFGDAAVALGVDTNGNAFVTGYSAFNSYPTYAYVTVAYSSGGVPLWTNAYASSIFGQSSLAKALVLNSLGNVCVTGTS
jgi:hypothetical protein